MKMISTIKYNIFKPDLWLVLFIILLLLSVESSLQTSIVWNRNSAWTLWLRKIGPFSIADIFILIIAVITFIKISLKQVIPLSPYLTMGILAIIYLFIGFIYNLKVFTLWKTYMYDFKVVLYLFVPYLFFYTIKRKTSYISLFTPKRLFICTAVASLIDFTIVNLFGKSEYPQFLGFPAVPVLVPMIVLSVGFAYSSVKLHRYFFLFFLCFELISAINRLSLGILVELASFLFYFFVIKLSLNFNKRFLMVLIAVLLVNLASLMFITNPFNWRILAAKAEGSLTRQIQMENVVENFGYNIPGVIGKGLGSTWFEFIQIPAKDIYSVGTSVGSTSENAMAMPVKFIFNFGPPALLYKWGVIGTVALIFLLTRYFHINFNRIKKLKQSKIGMDEIRYLEAILIISFLFVMGTFTYIGNLKPSLITSILAFYVENQIRVKESMVLSNVQ